MPVRDVATMLGVHRQTVYRWEWEAIEPELSDLGTLADLYGASLNWLVRGDGPAPEYLETFDDPGEPTCQTGS